MNQKRVLRQAGAGSENAVRLFTGNKYSVNSSNGHRVSPPEERMNAPKSSKSRKFTKPAKSTKLTKSTKSAKSMQFTKYAKSVKFTKSAEYAAHCSYELVLLIFSDFRLSSDS